MIRDDNKKAQNSEKKNGFVVVGGVGSGGDIVVDLGNPRQTVVKQLQQ